MMQPIAIDTEPLDDQEAAFFRQLVCAALGGIAGTAVYTDASNAKQAKEAVQLAASTLRTYRAMRVEIPDETYRIRAVPRDVETFLFKQDGKRMQCAVLRCLAGQGGTASRDVVRAAVGPCDSSVQALVRAKMIEVAR